MAKTVLGTVTYLLPLLFGLGFLAPVLVAAMQQFEISSVFGLAPLTFSLIIGGAWGLFATVTGRWI